MIFVLAVAACTAVPAPIVDHTGVDEAQYNRDLAACYDAMPAFAVGNPVTKCMEAKGYRILQGF